MSLKDWTPKIAALTFVGFVSTFLFISSLARFWTHQFVSGTWRLSVAVLLLLIFFRHRKIAFAIVALSSILVNAGLSAPFHPSVLGVTATVVSAALLYLLAVWAAQRYPHLRRQDWKAFFDRDPE
jgi:hypothetical protein